MQSVPTLLRDVVVFTEIACMHSPLGRLPWSNYVDVLDPAVIRGMFRRFDNRLCKRGSLRCLESLQLPSPHTAAAAYALSNNGSFRQWSGGISDRPVHYAQQKPLPVAVTPSRTAGNQYFRKLPKESVTGLRLECFTSRNLLCIGTICTDRPLEASEPALHVY